MQPGLGRTMTQGQQAVSQPMSADEARGLLDRLSQFQPPGERMTRAFPHPAQGGGWPGSPGFPEQPRTADVLEGGYPGVKRDLPQPMRGAMQGAIGGFQANQTPGMQPPPPPPAQSAPINIPPGTPPELVRAGLQYEQIMARARALQQTNPQAAAALTRMAQQHRSAALQKHGIPDVAPPAGR